MCLRGVVSLGVLFALGAPLGIQPADAPGPESLLRVRGEAFVAAMNADADALSAYARNHLRVGLGPSGASRFAAAMRDTVTSLGPIERHVVHVLPSGRALFVYAKHTRQAGWENYQFTADAADEHRLTLVFRAMAVEPMPVTAALLGSGDASRWLDRFFPHLEDQQPFSGIAVVRQGGKEVVTRIQGMADAARRRPVTRTTRFAMASGSKLFTAVAVLQLDQAGKLSLNDRLAAHVHLPTARRYAERVTLRELLSHTGGAGDYWTPDYERGWDSITSLPQMLPFVLPHLSGPSNDASYSNSGYILLGLVVEAVSGMSYYDYVQTHVFRPAGMNHTGYPTRSDLPEDAARPYEPTFDAGAVVRGSYSLAKGPARGTSAGGAMTTVDDVLRFADALQSGILLDSSHRALLTGAHVPTGAPDTFFGYGAMVDRSRGVTSYGHAGQAPGTTFDLRVFPDIDTVCLVASNLNTIAGPEMTRALDHLIRNTAR